MVDFFRDDVGSDWWRAHREKSLAKQVMHKENLALVQRVAVERQKERQAHWKKRCVEEEKSREQVADLLAVHAANWITEDTLKMHVERAVDTFLIAGDSERER